MSASSGEGETGVSETTCEAVARTLGLPFPWSRRDVGELADSGDEWLLVLRGRFHDIEHFAGFGMLPEKKPDSPLRPYISPSDFYPEVESPGFDEIVIRDEMRFQRAQHSLLTLLLQLPVVAIPDPLMDLLSYADKTDLLESKDVVVKWMKFLADMGDLVVRGRLLLVPPMVATSFHPLIEFDELPSWQAIGRDIVQSFACDGRGGASGMDLEEYGDTCTYIAAENVQESATAVAALYNRVDLYLPHPIHWHVAASVLRTLGVNFKIPTPLLEVPLLQPGALSPRLVRDLHADERGFDVWRAGLVSATAQLRSVSPTLEPRETQDYARDTMEALLGPAVEALAAAAGRTSATRLAMTTAVPLGISLATSGPTSAVGRALGPVGMWITGRRARVQAKAAVDLYQMLLSQR